MVSQFSAPLKPHEASCSSSPTAQRTATRSTIASEPEALSSASLCIFSPENLEDEDTGQRL